MKKLFILGMLLLISVLVRAQVDETEETPPTKEEQEAEKKKMNEHWKMQIAKEESEKEKIDGYIIDGSISGPYKGKVYLAQEQFMKGPQSNIDSCEVVDGKYTFKGPHIDTPKIYFIKSNDGQLTPLFLEDGRIRISGKAENFYWANVSGTINNDINYFYKFLTKYIQDSILQSTQLEWAKYGRDNYEHENSEFKRRGKHQEQRNLDIQKYLVKRFNDEAFAPFMAMFEMTPDVTLNEFKQIRKSIDPKLNNHPYTLLMDEFIQNQDFGVGTQAYDFSIKDINGKTINLKDYRGKYVLIDFWASWCGPCKREMPNVIKLYNECKGKNFEIIGISIDTKEDAWKKAVKEMGMKWPQACDLAGWEGPLPKRFIVSAVPRTVLVDPQGIVIALDLRGEELVAKVKELTGKK